MMSRIIAVILVVSFCLSMAPKVFGQISPVPKITEEALQFNESVLIDILKSDVDSVLDKALPEFQGIENIEADMKKFMGYLPAHEEGATYEAFSTEVRKTIDTKNSVAIYRTRYELTNLSLGKEVKDEWAMVDIYSQETDEGLKFRHFSFKSVLHQPTEVGKFEVKNKTIKHYVFLCLLIAMPIFIIFTIVAIIRNKHMTKKWLWGIFASFGLWGVNFNWITGKISPEFITVTTNNQGAGAWHFKLISIKVLGASIVKSGQYTPFIVTIGFPLGAILYWLLKHKDKAISQAFE